MVSGMSGMLRVVVVGGLGAIAAATELIPQRSSFFNTCTAETKHAEQICFGVLVA